MRITVSTITNGCGKVAKKLTTIITAVTIIVATRIYDNDCFITVLQLPSVFQSTAQSHFISIFKITAD